MGSGPINPATAALVPEDRRHRNAGDPKNLAVPVAASLEWNASDHSNILNRYLDAIASYAIMGSSQVSGAA